MGFLSWIVLGGVAGWIVSLIMKTDENQGILGNIFLGIVGAIVGGFIGNKLFNSAVTGLNISSLVLSVTGGLVFVFMWRILTGRKAL